MQLNPALINETTLARICEGYCDNTGDLNDDLFQITHAPFKVLKMKDLCSCTDFIKKLTDEVRNLDYERKNNDLYTLWQSADLSESTDGCISQFVATLRGDIGKMLSRIMNVEFNDNFTLTASLYETGDVLLCHDDKCTDRSVAFVFYLTGTGKEKGGAFEMFDKNDKGQPSSVVKSLPAVSNSFLCFEVGNFTYHQVSEVLDPTFKRLSLNGWFHSDRVISPFEYSDPMPPLFDQTVLPGEVFLDEFINAMYIKPTALKEAQTKFESDSEIMLENFLRSELYEKCLEELKRISKWTTKGSANRRQYGIVEDVEQPNLKKLISFLGSSTFFSYLSDMTGLALNPKDENDRNSSKYCLEVQKWSPGAYTMATDNDDFFKKFGLDLYLWFNSSNIALNPDNGGTVTYLASDQNDQDEELLNIDPVDNGLVLVYRMEDTVRFTKYLNHSTAGSYFCLAATYYEAEET